jgi:hypothetical protein
VSKGVRGRQDFLILMAKQPPLSPPLGERGAKTKKVVQLVVIFVATKNV